MNKPKSENQLLSSFRTYLKTASLLTDDKSKQIRIADEVFITVYNFSWIQKFEKAYKKIIGKDFIMVNEGADIAERHETGEKTSKGLNKGFAPDGYLNKGDMCKLLNDLFGCPSSMTESILEKYSKIIDQDFYPNEVEIAGSCRIVDVPCYKNVL